MYATEKLAVILPKKNKQTNKTNDKKKKKTKRKKEKKNRFLRKTVFKCYTVLPSKALSDDIRLTFVIKKIV